MSDYDSIEEIDINRDGAGMRIGIVAARFNADVSDGLLAGCTEELAKLGVISEDIRIATVPGALELPLALQAMAESGEYDALIALGAVIRGETYHFEIVSNESARGIMALTMDGLAIGNGILTTENEAQAIARADPGQLDKGGGAAQAAIAMTRPATAAARRPVARPPPAQASGSPTMGASPLDRGYRQNQIDVSPHHCPAPHWRQAL